MPLDESTRHVTRQHRDLVAAHLFKTICERFGVKDLAVSARNSTDECSHCGQVHEIGSELMHVCPVTGVEYDRDYNAARVMLSRASAAAREAAGKVAP